MKKLIISSLVCILMASVFNVNAYATPSEKSAVKAKLLEHKISEDKEEKIKNIINNASEKKGIMTLDNNKNEDTNIKYNLEEITEVYILPDLLLSSYNEKDGLMKLTNKDKRANVKINDNNGKSGVSSFIIDENNEIKLLGSVHGLDKDSMIPDYDTLSTIISENISNIKDIKFAQSFTYYTTFVLISAKDKEYLIPYSTIPEKIGLTNGKVYTSKEAIYKMSSIFDEKEAVKMAQENLFGGIPMKSQVNYIPIFAIITLVLSALTIITALRKKKSNTI